METSTSRGFHRRREDILTKMVYLQVCWSMEEGSNAKPGGSHPSFQVVIGRCADLARETWQGGDRGGWTRGD